MCFISSNALTVNWVYEMFTFVNLTECNEGKFGLHCNQSCGFCLDKGQWHYINGTCLNWCDSGYKERDCKQGNCLTKVQINFFYKNNEPKAISEYYWKKNRFLFKLLYNEKVQQSVTIYFRTFHIFRKLNKSFYHKHLLY